MVSLSYSKSVTSKTSCVVQHNSKANLPKYLIFFLIPYSSCKKHRLQFIRKILNSGQCANLPNVKNVQIYLALRNCHCRVHVCIVNFNPTQLLCNIFYLKCVCICEFHSLLQSNHYWQECERLLESMDNYIYAVIEQKENGLFLLLKSGSFYCIHVVTIGLMADR